MIERLNPAVQAAILILVAMAVLSAIVHDIAPFGYSALILGLAGGCAAIFIRADRHPHS